MTPAGSYALRGSLPLPLCAAAATAPRAHLFTAPRALSRTISSSSLSLNSSLRARANPNPLLANVNVNVRGAAPARSHSRSILGRTNGGVRQLSHSSARLRKDDPSTGGQFSFRGMPAPPRLPKEEQDVFEALQRQSTGAFSTPRINQSPDSSSPTEGDAAAATVDGVKDQTKPQENQYTHVIDASGAGEELHPNLVRGAQPEFEGDRNPKTGEIGGPKNEPLRWGPSGEWTYNGRATDF
ncbi:hypothetical protein AYO21_06225 [Fonsecaea monophora]|uniref:Succinate dehydrogenase assembly factor 4, mitochondrial n=1 Tax=Fonsecaea monophora TaxID=254056 RepID=A0A177F7B9_9EURO|nr:hypothetical protein AYO21_06225 [Fonsecaea monophora]KAH0840871.1 putative protein FMP21, precursor [Fonsecaea pedrosoi]OAG39581.1 hypothetical protein AYO21_06225 [Fonsecaea monophora]